MKVYQKPEIRFESFAISENVALACTWVKKGEKYENEGLGGLTLFSAGMGCDVNDGEIYCLTNLNDLMGEYTVIS